MRHKKRNEEDAGFASLFHTGRQRPGTSDSGRWALMLPIVTNIFRMMIVGLLLVAIAFVFTGCMTAAGSDWEWQQNNPNWRPTYSYR
jgi:hypothetical protein